MYTIGVCFSFFFFIWYVNKPVCSAKNPCMVKARHRSWCCMCIYLLDTKKPVMSNKQTNKQTTRKINERKRKRRFKKSNAKSIGCMHLLVKKKEKKERQRLSKSLQVAQHRRRLIILIYVYTFFFLRRGEVQANSAFLLRSLHTHTHKKQRTKKKKTNTHDFGIGIRTYICACSSHCQPDRSHLSSFSFEYRLFLLFLYLSHALQRYMCMHWKKKKNKRHSFHNFAQSVFFSFVTFFFLQLTRVRFFPSQSCEFAAETVFFFFFDYSRFSTRRVSCVFLF